MVDMQQVLSLGKMACRTTELHPVINAAGAPYRILCGVRSEDGRDFAFSGVVVDPLQASAEVCHAKQTMSLMVLRLKKAQPAIELLAPYSDAADKLCLSTNLPRNTSRQGRFITVKLAR